MYNIRHRKGIGTWSVCVSEGRQASKLGWLEVRVHMVLSRSVDSRHSALKSSHMEIKEVACAWNL